MPPKKRKKVVVKRSMTIQGFNIQGSKNILKGASVEDNTAESGTAEEEIIIQGFNLTESSNDNDLENAFAKNNYRVAAYESESDNEKENTDKTSELKEKIAQLKKDEEEFEKDFEKQRLGLDNLKNMIKTAEKEQKNNDVRQENSQLQEEKVPEEKFGNIIQELSEITLEAKELHQQIEFDNYLKNQKQKEQQPQIQIPPK